MDYSIFHTSWGWMGAAGSSSGLKHLVLPCSSSREVKEALFVSKLQTEYSKQDDGNPAFRDLARRLRLYFGGQQVSFPDSLDLAGATPFQREVWLALKDIPYGKTVSYGEIADRLGKPLAARAIGQALSRNPLPVILPCHRVIGRSGKLVGYAGGIEVKTRLLELEASNSQHYTKQAFKAL